MTEVAATSATSQATQTSGTSTSSAKTADYDAFLNLLVAQLKNQDPTNPSDPAQFLSQLASFSSVEQQIQTNEKLSSLISLSQAGNVAELIGTQVISPDKTMAGTVLSVTLGADGTHVNLENGDSFLLGQGAQIFKL